MAPAIPAIYGELTPTQAAHYSAWIDALYRQADHALDCRGCTSTIGDCLIGLGLRAQEQRMWEAWHAVRRQERQ